MRLSAVGLSVERGGRRVVAGVSMELGPGGLCLVTGANGAGKSSLLRAIAGLLPLAGGTLSARDLPPDEPIASHAHYLGHQDGMKGALTASENLAFWASQLGGAGLSPQAALTRLGVPQTADFPVGYLSAGQKRRVALARLLVARRPLWLLDEPTNALDVSAQALFAAVLREHLAQGGLAVAATHAPLGLDPTLELRLGTHAPVMRSAED